MSSRIIVKNIPNSIDESSLRRILGRAGTVTSINWPRTEAGTRRSFAYVGYKTEEEASAAISSFNKTFIGLQKIMLEYAIPKIDKAHERNFKSHRRALIEIYDKKDPDFLRLKKKMKSKVPMPWENSLTLHPEESAPPTIEKVQPSIEEQIKLSRRLLFRGFPPITIKQDILSLLSSYGPIENVDMVEKKKEKVALVLFQSEAEAIRAYNEKNNCVFMGRVLRAIPAEPKKPDVISDRKYSFKERKGMKEKIRMDSEVNWNTFFIGQEAVADYLSHRLGVTKAKLLDSADENVSTRLALAEAELREECLQYFKGQGVVLFHAGPEDISKRSNTLILVKNLDFSINERDIRAAFGAYGKILNILVPPTRCIAIVEFECPEEAQEAFSGLSYTRLRSLPLYLEWVPECLLKFTEPLEPEPDNKARNGGGGILYVRNISFKTTSCAFSAPFSQYSGYIQSTICLGRDEGKGSTSKGYGFVEYETREDAEEALCGLQGVELDGRNLVIEHSNPRKMNDSDVKKILVRNVAFEATKRDLKNLFGALGKLKSVRLPSKVDGGHRGFGFIEYESLVDSQIAMEVLNGTHLYKRRLVLEWAQDLEGEEKSNRKMRRIMLKMPSNGPPSGIRIMEEE